LRPCGPNGHGDEKKDGADAQKIPGCHNAPA
jgi:hypothetical protein